jgi:phosphatidylethanolamine/phosphatidyl-N-methylethanolamine N-methyltransferase
MELICFLKEYLASPKHVGGVAPSSHALAELITETAGVREAKTVLEFGPGTGVFTEVIARKLQPDATFLAIEISEEFVKQTRERCPNVEVIHDSAANAAHHLAALDLDSCDCIVSGLPFAVFDPSLQDTILGAAHAVLRPGGVFVTFTYFFSPWLPRGIRFHRRLRAHFPKIEKTHIVWRNMFPAFAYRCIKEED